MQERLVAGGDNLAAIIDLIPFCGRPWTSRWWISSVMTT